MRYVYCPNLGLYPPCFYHIIARSSSQTGLGSILLGIFNSNTSTTPYTMSTRSIYCRDVIHQYFQRCIHTSAQNVGPPISASKVSFSSHIEIGATACPFSRCLKVKHQIVPVKNHPLFYPIEMIHSYSNKSRVPSNE